MKGKDVRTMISSVKRMRNIGWICGLLLAMAPAWGAFQLESTGIILEEREGRASFTILNTSQVPLLLASQVEDLDNMGFSKNVLLSPPITRIEPGQSQQVNFLLKKGIMLPHEVMLKASFEGIMQVVENSAQMPIRQSVSLIIQPAAVAMSPTPWTDLKITRDRQTLVLSNTGKHVIRYAPQLILNPSGSIMPLDSLYLMAGETRRVPVSGSPVSIGLTPLSRYGAKLPEVTLPVSVE
ncbi:TPA: fimbria/pilus chaperone family protein [Serratia marcescens]